MCGVLKIKWSLTQEDLSDVFGSQSIPAEIETGASLGGAGLAQYESQCQQIDYGVLEGQSTRLGMCPSVASTGQD